MSPVELSVVIPVYGSEETLPDLFGRLLVVLTSLGKSFEIIFVDDASRDDSWRQLMLLHAQYPECVQAIQLTRNFGQHNALMAGFHHARGAVIVTMDDDLQHPPEELPKLLEILAKQDLDLVYGTYETKKHAIWRNLGSNLAVRLFRAVFQVKVTPTAFRAIKRQIVESVLSYQCNFTIVDGLFAWSTQRIGEITVEHHSRSAGRSGYSIAKLVLQSMNLLTNFSLAPLQLVSALGALTSVSGIGLAAYYVVLYFRSDLGVPGFATVIVTLLVSTGLQMLSLGIIGEYLGRVLLNINQKPQFLLRRVLQISSATSTDNANHVSASR